MTVELSQLSKSHAVTLVQLRNVEEHANTVQGKVHVPSTTDVGKMADFVLDLLHRAFVLSAVWKPFKAS